MCPSTFPILPKGCQGEPSNTFLPYPSVLFVVEHEPSLTEVDRLLVIYWCLDSLRISQRIRKDHDPVHD
jgi:hypothetical protein